MRKLIEAYASLTVQIAQLERSRDALASQIISESGHDLIGQRTYEVDGCKFTVTTKENHTLDKARLSVDCPEWLPVNRSVSYTLREREYKAMLEYGTPEQRDFLAEIVTTKPAKVQIKVVQS